MLVRSGPIAPEEEGILAALVGEAAGRGAELVTVLMGTAAYEAEGPATRGAALPGTVWILEDDHRGRGLRVPPGGTARPVSPDELVEGVMTAEKVISLS